MNTQYLLFSSIIFFLDFGSIELTSNPPFTETVSKCGESMPESSLE